jgi:primase-like protein
MHESGIKLLNLMFREGESICVSPNKYGYHSIPLLDAFKDKLTLLSTKFRDGEDPEKCVETYPTDELKLVALNPINGWRDDASCYKYRNFLIEMDYGALPEQLAYIKKLEMPYSAVVFSGGKSLHFLISVTKDFADESIYRKVAEWILAIVTLADQNTKNPSRSIRIPGTKRDESRQALVEFKGPVENADLGKWLQRYPDSMPKEPEKIARSGSHRMPNMKPWMKKALLDGQFPADKGRNKTWFAIACEFALRNWDEDECMEVLQDFFQPDRDFKMREWKTTIRSAFKYIHENRKS